MKNKTMQEELEAIGIKFEPRRRDELRHKEVELFAEFSERCFCHQCCVARAKALAANATDGQSSDTIM